MPFNKENIRTYSGNNLMIDTKEFLTTLQNEGVNFFAGVPDSLLKSFCALILDEVEENNHIIAANEGAAVGLAVGHHVSTGQVPCVYLQNSGLGNTVNPLISAVGKSVFSVPLLLIVGWRGEPGVKDEPQHVSQGEVTLGMLEAMGIKYKVLKSDSPDFASDVQNLVKHSKETGTATALVVTKNTFSEYKVKTKIKNDYMKREEALKAILPFIPKNSAVFATTGKLSRELFELRHPEFGNKYRDLLTVGSMGHCQSVALGAALSSPEITSICMDGDGSLLMHMGSLAISGSRSPKNFKYILFNNGAHESVGGQPTVGFNVDFPLAAKACGFAWTKSASTPEEISNEFESFLGTDCAAFLEIKIGTGSRSELGRPTVSPINVKENLIEFYKNESL
jgi:phosphonopyruvate decarboxylase